MAQTTDDTATNLWEAWWVKKPALRVTKWLGDIPVEAECRSCAGVNFRAESRSHRPQREEYRQSLQSQFDAHLQQVHRGSDADANRSAGK